jgi:hypothetical protein
MEKSPEFTSGLAEFFFKIFVPAFIAVTIKIATQVKREKMNVTRIIISFIVGIGCAYFVYPFVHGNVESGYIPLLVGIVAMSGEKIAEYVIYKWDVDKLLGSLLDAFFRQRRSK